MMQDRIAQRLTQLQQEQQQTQQALAALEQQRQGLLQQLIGQQYAVEVLQALLREPHDQEPINAELQRLAACMPQPVAP